MQQSSATPKNQDIGRGLRKIVACSKSSSQCLLVSTVFGTVSSDPYILYISGFLRTVEPDTLKRGHLCLNLIHQPTQ